MEMKTDIWAGALIRRVQVNGAYATVARRGDPDGGDVLVKVATLDGRARLYGTALGPAGETIFLDLSAGALGDEEQAVDAFAQKRTGFDPDLWIIEIEDKQGRHFLTEKVDSAKR